MDKKEQEKVIHDVAFSNTHKYNLLKSTEEFMELSLILTQQRTKKSKDFTKDIIDEIGDCKIRLAILEHLYDKEKIETRVVYKLTKFKEYLDNKQYKEHI